jgi:hypothetical protein
MDDNWYSTWPKFIFQEARIALEAEAPRFIDANVTGHQASSKTKLETSIKILYQK